MWRPKTTLLVVVLCLLYCSIAVATPNHLLLAKQRASESQTLSTSDRAQVNSDEDAETNNDKPPNSYNYSPAVPVIMGLIAIGGVVFAFVSAWRANNGVQALCCCPCNACDPPGEYEDSTKRENEGNAGNSAYQQEGLLKQEPRSDAAIVL